MKRLLILGLMLVLLTACGESEPPFTDNGKPGQIKVIVFIDANSNGIMEAGESGTASRVAIAQEVSCPPISDPDLVDTDSNGTHTYQELQPGKYCVFFESNGLAVTTKMTREVYVSSEQTTTVYFGFAK